ncbi:type II toxin-antitoxin system Phd/YefM family antitoxin [Proteiniclasticum sp. BAD-10]|uniref:Type II toxin-antitoxin system Phd/YefM family antitoxin n=1 Tax=Proteiniclasticum sediminis TaxID=2804028 RepID=A0A941HPP0_9CLOT|nr:type II toxin-antitoxin system Phd/YefM family antitoxin [Proteiniclasticum sediminis]MBR0575636.1 type II toxin-antitoxin system Phd/YefM family antitoxin [Proteiniclasticum sediminis]
MSHTPAEKTYPRSIDISCFNGRKASRIFEEIRTEGTKIVLQQSKPVGVILAPEVYLALLEQLEELNLLVVANERLTHGSPETVSFPEALYRLGLTQDNLVNVPVDLDLRPEK